MTHRRRHTAIAVMAAAAALLAAPGAASAALLDQVAPAAVVIGAPVTATGTPGLAYAGQQVVLEQDVAGTWTRVGVPAVVDPGGAWSIAFVPKRGGALRAVLPAAGPTGISAVRSLAVTPKVLAPRLGRGDVLPFGGARASWRIAPATWPTGKVRVELSIDGRAAGHVITTARNGRVSVALPTNGVGRFRAKLVLPQAPGFTKSAGGVLLFAVRGQRVGAGSSAAWTTALRRALRYRGFYTPGGTGFDTRMGDAVIAFHKAYGRSRTASFEASDWKRLTANAVKPRFRGRGLHIEIDKGRQILMQVRNGKPTMIIHVSTGATGNTPAGTHEVQWKGDWVPSLYGSLLYKSMAFQGAYAIHGYPSVPTTPASHGCVRVPMWIAATLYDRSPVGTPVRVYEGPGGTRPSTGRRDVPELAGVDVARFADEGATA